MIKVIKQNPNINVLKMMEKSGAVLEGHFKLTSGYHSAHYLQCAKLLQHPDLAHILADETKHVLGQSVDIEGIDMVISPAIGGIIFGYMLAYRIGTDMIYAERKGNKMELRRGFGIEEKSKAIIAEDVITTGGSVKEVMEICRQNRAEVIAVTSIVDRSQGVDFGVPYKFLIQLEIDNFSPSECSMCTGGVPLDIPGSRK